MDNANNAKSFERLVGLVFERHNFEVEYNRRIASNDRPRVFEVDLVLTWKDVRSVVEVKAYRTRTPSIADIVRTADLLAHARESLPADHAVLVTSLRRDQLPPLDSLVGNITVLGLEDLFRLANGDALLLSDLADVDRELNSALGEFDRPTNLSPASETRDISTLKIHATTFAPPPPSPPGKGAGLADELSEITPGKAHRQKLSSGRKAMNWRLFELVSFESLEYIFENSLDTWIEQEAVGGDSNRLDAMAKVRGNDVFCRTLIEHFSSRHILFEFKNHAKEVKPNSVHITEKYLFPTALRSTAIIISPHGLSPQAIDAAKGALRDTGKLILSINVATLIDMLLAKDQGVAPSLKMEGLLDSFLQSLGR